MSLDIHLYPKNGNIETEVASMNWLRNPYGLCNWAEDNVEAAGVKFDTKLWYVVNHWNYKKSPKVNRALFKSVVDGYWRVIQKLDKGYFFFNVYSYIQFVESHRDLLPKEYIKIINEERIKGLCHALPDKIGIPIEYFTLECFNLGFNHGDKFEAPLDKYKAWFFELVQFAEKLQDENLQFYCSN